MRKPTATWVIPSEDEWYKAAYHKNDGATGNYWDYATSSDTQPTNDLIDPDPGNGANYDSYHDGAWDDTIGDPYWRTEVGAFKNSASPYGTFDQAGNVREWTEASVGGTCRVKRGGGYGWREVYMCASVREFFVALEKDSNIGFRLALVPEPATIAILLLGGSAMLRRRR
jgi:formylglycine-generating enzyme required for sulfatase activity